MWKWQSKKDKEIVRLYSLLDAAAYIVLARDARIHKLQGELAGESVMKAIMEENFLNLQRLYQELEATIPKAVTVPPISSQPLYLTEQQEDIEYAFANDMIDKATYEDMLAQLAFDNSEINYDYERID